MSVSFYYLKGLGFGELEGRRKSLHISRRARDENFDFSLFGHGVYVAIFLASSIISSEYRTVP
jgi:hypothetical protein